jgi:hypothetical protein
MRSSWSSGRPLFVALLLTLAFTLAAAGGAYAQAAQQAPAQQAPAQPLTYPGDALVSLNYVQTDKAADFENMWAKLKEAVGKSSNETTKKQAEGWTVFKSSTPSGADGVTLYVVIINPIVKDADYTAWKILQQAFPQDYVDIYNKYSASFRTTGQKVVPINLNILTSLK